MALPTITGTDDFDHGDFTVPGGGPYGTVSGTPAKDVTIVHAPDPASLLIEVTSGLEYVQHNIPGSRTRPWHGFWWRMESADEPAGIIDIVRCTVNAGNDAYLAYSPTVDQLQHRIGAGTPQAISYTLGTWVWVEQIFDVTADPATLYTRVNGVDLTPITIAHVASDANGWRIGIITSATGKIRFSNAHWGYAAAPGDWLGAPGGPTLDSCLPDADVVTTGWSTAPLFSKINDASDATVIQATAS